jgi:hypothetical protein
MTSANTAPCRRVRAVNIDFDSIEITEALEKYFNAARCFNALIAQQCQIADKVVKECAYRAMMVLSTYHPCDMADPPIGPRATKLTHDRKSDKEAFFRLLKLSRAEYDRVRVKEAEALDIRVATLDKETEALAAKK